MMKLVFMGLVLLGTQGIALLYSGSIQEEFKLFQLQHGKVYVDQSEEEFRFKIYLENRETIAMHNQLYYQGLVTYTMAINQFGDLLHDEYLELTNGVCNFSAGPSVGSTCLSPSHGDLPDAVDWRKEGRVTPVINQGNCTAAWAFSAVGSLEGQNFIKTGKLIPLSAQNLIDCTGLYGNKGCKGGSMEDSFMYITTGGGIDTEESYPYTAKDGQCNYRPDKSGATVSRILLIGRKETILQDHVANDGPISVVIDSRHKSFKFYSEGVYYEDKCRNIDINHPMLAVGYGTDAKDGDYWILKNTWGEDWGENGYMRLARNKDNHCGVATAAIRPDV